MKALVRRLIGASLSRETTMSKVLHVSDYLHTRVVIVCREAEIGIKEWTNRVLMKFIEEGRAAPPQPVPRKKTELSNGGDRREGPSPWELPPFWQRERDESDLGLEAQDQLEEDSPGPLEEIGEDDSREPRAEGRNGAGERGRTFSSGEGSNEAA